MTRMYGKHFVLFHILRAHSRHLRNAVKSPPFVAMTAASAAALWFGARAVAHAHRANCADPSRTKASAITLAAIAIFAVVVGGNSSANKQRAIAAQRVINMQAALDRRAAADEVKRQAVLASDPHWQAWLARHSDAK